ncbi:hypothetical protein [Flavobacterium luteolum]|uniref:hypothetical protein n=1 Tax=Flavobacterium luteolum TaxID=3003259 RepID=UPI00248DCBE2|nr:hypothetical protein [Flavobacterium luteolum]
MLIEKDFDIREILIKTTYQIVVCDENSFKSVPVAYGSGFFLNYKENLFFITADHNIHYEDHQNKKRLGTDNFLGIFNNISNKQELNTIITPIGGFYFMESIDLSKEDLDYELIDVAISLVDRTKFEAPFLTDEDLKDDNQNIIVSPNEQKFEFLEEHIIEPSEDDTYYVYGKIRPEIKGLFFLHRKAIFMSNLKYIQDIGNYLLLNTEDQINDYEDWAGLSGSPVINQNGKCIGVLCSVIENSKSLFVKPFSKILPLLDTISIQEKLLKK